MDDFDNCAIIDARVEEVNSPLLNLQATKEEASVASREWMTPCSFCAGLPSRTRRSLSRLNKRPTKALA